VPAEAADTGAVLRIGRGADTAAFDLADGARLISLRLGGTELLVPRADREPLWWGAFVMAPWTGDLPDAELRFGNRRWRMPCDDGRHASHGVARASAWTHGRDGVLRTPLANGWPLGGVVEARPELAAGRFRLTLSVLAGRTTMPAAVGWHPWFPRRLPGSRPVELTLPPGARQLVRDDRGRATARFGSLGPAPYNETLELPGPVQAHWPGRGRLTIASTSPLATVFSAHEQGVCVEPVTSPAERMDHVLQPGERLELGVDLTWADAAGA
jgi:galactose mutarotase-like enzyme